MNATSPPGFQIDYIRARAKLRSSIVELSLLNQTLSAIRCMSSRDDRTDMIFINPSVPMAILSAQALNPASMLSFGLVSIDCLLKILLSMVILL